MAKSIETEIGCPFFITEGKNHITCEGLLQGTKSTHKFSDDRLKLHFEKTVCVDTCGRKCPHYRTLSQLYERGLRV